MIDAFRVWLRPLGDSCRVRVEGYENANWLLTRLGQSLGIQPAEACPVADDSTYSTFQVAYRGAMSHSAFEQMLRSIPGVHLMNQPE